MFPEVEEPPSDTNIKYQMALEISFTFRFDNINELIQTYKTKQCLYVTLILR